MSNERIAPSIWPKITPSGHVYKAPITYAELCERHVDAAQAAVEGWDLDEHPPEPTWEMVGLAHAEIRALRAVVADGLEAWRLTREYLGSRGVDDEYLPEQPGWSWFDWCEKARNAAPSSGSTTDEVTR